MSGGRVVVVMMSWVMLFLISKHGVGLGGWSSSRRAAVIWVWFIFPIFQLPQGVIVCDGEESVVDVGEFGVVSLHELSEGGAFPVPGSMTPGFAVGAVPVLLSRDRAGTGSVVACACATNIV